MERLLHAQDGLPIPVVDEHPLVPRVRAVRHVQAVPRRADRIQHVRDGEEVAPRGRAVPAADLEVKVPEAALGDKAGFGGGVAFAAAVRRRRPNGGGGRGSRRSRGGVGARGGRAACQRSSSNHT